MALSFDSTSTDWAVTSTNMTQLYNLQAGSILGGGLSQYENAQNSYQQAYNQLSAIQYITTQSPTPAPAKKKSRGFIAELRDEIDAWHGDILAA